MSSPKGNDRLPESQQEKSSKYFEQFQEKRAIVFSGPSNSNVSSLDVPKINPLSNFYASFDTSNFDDDDSIKNEQASSKHHFHIISI